MHRLQLMARPEPHPGVDHRQPPPISVPLHVSLSVSLLLSVSLPSFFSPTALPECIIGRCGAGRGCGLQRHASLCCRLASRGRLKAPSMKAKAVVQKLFQLLESRWAGRGRGIWGPLHAFWRAREGEGCLLEQAECGQSHGSDGRPGRAAQTTMHRPVPAPRPTRRLTMSRHASASGRKVPG